MGLIFVPTPLGNLRDITLRALDALRDADLIVAEDTRVARRLLSALQIPGKRLTSYREANAERATSGILDAARGGAVAVVSDAGTPGISDPGRELIVAARAGGVQVEVLPGPVAFVCAAVLSGFPTEGLTFEGFVPRQARQRESVFRRALAGRSTTAWYESPQRIAATLQTLVKLAPDTPVFVARELTKMYEQQLFATPAEVAAALPSPVRGEIVLVLGPSAQPADEARSEGSESLDDAIAAALAEGAPVTAIAKRLAQRFGIDRSDAYARVAARKNANAAKPED
ncbi:MAG: 16S rRNA (cytidine(1402)-2'-O)-methyltransferase [Candidatus Eremiobacteraeota bacterium]|nr:16S rRNA (cytidine(1402)-2'-O)-methyltransferase [Candidatus Eremiobacteraeota bacterium]